MATSIPIQFSHGCLMASIQVDLDDEVLARFQEDLLGRIRETGARGVILDLSGIAVMDSADFEAVRKTVCMADLMGADPVLVGLQPGVVSSLVELNVDLTGIRAALTLEDAFELLSGSAGPAADPAGEVADEPG